MRINKIIFFTTLITIVGLISFYFSGAESKHFIGITIAWAIGIIIIIFAKLGILKIKRDGRWCKYNDYYIKKKNAIMEKQEK